MDGGSGIGCEGASFVSEVSVTPARRWKVSILRESLSRCLGRGPGVLTAKVLSTSIDVLLSP